ncbi:hypothetical protein [Nocardia panacis]|uniref:hypothetical protein n=1 Tax=Nocardia panacis TaxID=2340916 RepID=UPI0011C3455F|nr:hypothetical protein [Nocardia panacis]
MAAATSDGIASYVGRRASDITHHLSGAGGLRVYRAKENDVFRGNRKIYRIAEPLVTFYQAILRPDWSEWERTRLPARLRERRSHRFQSNVLGPHFEEICRNWVVTPTNTDNPQTRRRLCRAEWPEPFGGMPYSPR